MKQPRTAWTRQLSEIRRHDLALVGGKGANLGELLGAGFPVPSGFCVTTSAFTAFVATQPDMERLYTALETLTPTDVDGAQVIAQQVRAALSATPMPAEIEQAILVAWQGLGSEHAYGVRSSATAEDLPDASFAGQQDTFLNVCGGAAILEAVRNCWVSLFTDRAVLYRLQHGFAHRDVGLAVVVQRMVVPDVAGIMFTADPVSGNRSLLSIDASYGLGEALVSGIVSADLYQVDMREQRLVKRQIGEKQLQIQPLPQGGVERRPVAGEDRAMPALQDEQILALANLGQSIAAHYGAPQDIEWALAQGQWFVLQARPITSLFPLPQPAPNDDTLHVYFSFGHFQVMTDPMPPLAASLWRIMFPLGRPRGALENPLVASAAGRLYIDISNVARHPLLGRVVPMILRNADMLAGLSLQTVIARQGFRRGPVVRLAMIAKIAIPLLGQVVRQCVWASPEKAAEHGLALINQSVAEVDARLQAAPAGIGRLRTATSVLHNIFFQVVKEWFAVPAAGMLASSLLNRLAARFATADDRTMLGRGLRGNVTTDMDLAVGDLADLVRQSPQLVAHLSAAGVPAALVEATAALPGGAAFLSAWQQFLARYGERAPGEIDLFRPRWNEDPTSLLQMVLGSASHGEYRAHRIYHERLVAAGEAAVSRVVQAAGRGPWGWLRGPIVKRLAYVARSLGPTREHHKFWIVRLMALVKPVIVEAGQRLAAQGRIANPEDVWFLSVPELFAALERPQKRLLPLIAERQVAFAHAWKLSPPRIITSEGEIPLATYAAGAPEGALVGSPVSAGVVEGIARVVRDPQTQRLLPGEILVAPFTDPGWTPLFIHAAGLVMEIGGLMTHGSVVAREYGIPAVVGVPDATTRIRTGQRVRVHGTAGYVELLDDL